MSYIAGLEFCFDFNYSDIDLDKTEKYFIDLISQYSDIVYRQKTDIRINLIEGSLRVYIAVLGSLYIGIGQYGSFRSGIDALVEDAKSIKELVERDIFRGGVRESDLVYSKKIFCAPDKIRRVLLAIDRLESKNRFSKIELKIEISKIKTSVNNICSNISDKDAGLFALSIDQKYWPEDTRIPEYAEKFKLLAREEDVHCIVHSSKEKIINRQFKKNQKSI